jgi:hypothetical protein
MFMQVRESDTLIVRSEGKDTGPRGKAVRMALRAVQSTSANLTEGDHGRHARTHHRLHGRSPLHLVGHGRWQKMTKIQKATVGMLIVVGVIQVIKIFYMTGVLS